jgi:two-component system LytT family response regulator
MSQLEVLDVLIIDDEKLARQKIARFLAERPESFSIREAANGLEAKRLIAERAPLLILLDVEMPGLSGLELLAQLEERPFKVVFQTAFADFALRAFEENACDYLLKPFPAERFNQAIDRALRAADSERRLRNLERRSGQSLERLVVKQGSRMQIVNVADIECFVSRDHYTCIHTRQGEYVCDLSLSHLEERLDGRIFQRLHRSNIVRLAAVQAITRGENMSVRLSGGLELPVSRNNRARLKEAVG